MTRPIRYHKTNGALFIGGENNKLAVIGWQVSA